ncbi:uncharacterized protein A4U43_C06F17820 [Asparagus officinalis]|uniref:Vps41 C-terminal RING finger domain-containing protein n=2 Tax=Asparagus officinalis TaxID=4686 RepID=A0A5P1EMJ5_ASPOF|nr:uncharacterized protein A4U43_C06F17820 [Asparagus officinalis]
MKYYKEARHAIYLSSIEEETLRRREDNTSNNEMAIMPTSRTMDVKSKTRGGARCCLCFDPFSLQNLSVIIFFCCHAFHVSCLLGGADSIDIGSEDIMHIGDDGDDSDEDGNSGGSWMRCVLCTTTSG